MQENVKKEISSLREDVRVKNVKLVAKFEKENQKLSKQLRNCS